MNRLILKKITAFVLIWGMMVSLAGCGSRKHKSYTTLRVGVITYTQNDAFINALTDCLKTELKSMETAHMKIIVSIRSADDDQEDQDEGAAEMIDAGCDILCVNLVDRTAPSKIIRNARDNDIPVIFFNREPVMDDLMQWDKLYYVGGDARQSGMMQGEIAADMIRDNDAVDRNQDGKIQYVLLEGETAADYINEHPEVDRNRDGKIQYILLEGEAGHQDAISRTDSSVKTLISKDITLEKLSYQFADWNRGQAENRMTQLISQYGNSIEMVISNNDEMALGAVEAYKKAGYTEEEWPVIFGIDGLKDALEAVEAGTMQGTVYNDKEDQAREMAKLAVDIFKENDIESHDLSLGRYYVSPYQKVDESSVEKFLKPRQ